MNDQTWSRSTPAVAARELLLRGVFGPLVAGYADVSVIGREQLDAIAGPVVLVANHASHVDTPVLLGALSAHRRRRTLVAAAADYWYTNAALGAAVSLAFGTVPVTRRREGEESGSVGPLAKLVAGGYSVLVFGEGTRSRSGRLGPFRPGAAALARRARVPLVPVHVAGTARLMPPGRAWMVRAREARERGESAPRAARQQVTVSFGAALTPGPDDDVIETMDEVRQFMVARA